MSTTKLKFAIFGDDYRRQQCAPHIERALRFLLAHGAEAQVNPTDLGNPDYVICFGGDGTFLKTAMRVGAMQVPIIGVNMGRLGFLTDVLPSEIDKSLQRVLGGDYNIENHTVIEVDSDHDDIRGCHFALNDIAVLKRDTASMISVKTYINGDFLVNYQADGLIVATPTGSTAYNLSNGGPIIVPQSGSLCLTPVAPHSLNIRPIVINDTSEVTLEVESRSHSFLIAIDGRSEKLVEGTRLTIRRAPYVVRIVKLTDRRYFSALREKLMWGADTRAATE